MAVPVADAMQTDAETAAVSPRQIILHIGDYRCEAMLTAATEGTTRFIASAPGESGQYADAVGVALRLLSEQCGYALTQEEIEAVLVRGRPLLARVVGEPNEEARAALHVTERDGVVRTVAPPAVPPRGGRLTDWVRQVAEQFERGDVDLLIVALPPGDLPEWAAQLLNAVQAAPPGANRHLIVFASSDALAPALVPGTVLLERNDTLPQRFAERLTRIHIAHRTPDFSASVNVCSSITAVAAGLAFARHDGKEAIAYLDLSEGSTIIVAHPSGVEVLHDAACDSAAGAVTLLHRLGVEAVAQWIPFPIDAAALRTWAVRRVAAPRALLIDPVDRAIAGGFARATLRALVAKSAAIQTATRCIIGPGLLHTNTIEDAMLAVADVLSASRIVEIAMDVDDLMPVVGYFAMHRPDSARSLLTHDALAPLGAILTHAARNERDDSGIAAVLAGHGDETRTTIVHDALTVVDVRSTSVVNVIRRDGREEALVVQGGPGGLLIDTRARPLRGGAGRPTARGNVSDRLRAALAWEEARHGE
ncbi:MAG: hypothetical protein ACR2JW_09560 [Thermomicrobiales bacterium]